MKIYWIKAQAPRRVLALVKHLGINAELVEVDLMAGGRKAPEYAGLNPDMKAPMLVDGELELWESSAIMAHLCIKAGSDMWPAHNPAEQVEVLRWLDGPDANSCLDRSLTCKGLGSGAGQLRLCREGHCHCGHALTATDKTPRPCPSI